MADDTEPRRRNVVRLDPDQFGLGETPASAQPAVQPDKPAAVTQSAQPAVPPESTQPAAPQPAPAPDAPQPKPKLRLIIQDGQPVVDDDRGGGGGGDGSGGSGGGTPDEPPQAWSEDALASLVFDEIKDDWRYDAGNGHWHHWDGTHWARDRQNRVLPIARRACRQASARARSTAGGSANLARAVSAIKSARAAIEFARAEPPIAVEAGQFDADSWVLNTPGGIVDLKSGQCLPHDRAKLCAKLAGAAPEGDCPLWLAFLNDATNGDREYVDYLQRVVGYSLTGCKSEEVFVFLYGPSNTGKTVFVEIWRALLGDYSWTAPMDAFLPPKGERHPADLAGFVGRRLVTAAETEAGRRWDRQRLTTLTGRDRVSARFMRGDFFEFDATFILAFHGNFRPTLDGWDTAMRRRAHLLPFRCRPPQIDRHLRDKLKVELGGIMVWAIEGCRLWQKSGLAPPKAVTEATDEYFESQNYLGDWVAERCELGDDCWGSQAELYGDFQRALQAEGVGFVMRQSQFVDQLVTAYPVKRKRSRQHAGARGVDGIQLKGRQDKGRQDELPI
jgi:P4 family phage/plasmid primase-like protien